MFLSHNIETLLEANSWKSLDLIDEDILTARQGTGFSIEKVKAVALNIIEASVQDLRKKNELLRGAKENLAADPSLEKLNTFTAQLKSVHGDLYKIHDFVYSKMFEELENHLFIRNQLKEMSRGLENCISFFGVELIPHLRSALAKNERSPTLDVLLQRLITTKNKTLDVSEGQELRSLFLGYRLMSQPSCLDLDASAKDQLTSLPIIFQAVILVDSNINQQLFDYLVDLSKPCYRDLLLLLHETAYYICRGNTEINTWRSTLLELWKLGEKELVTSALQESRGYTENTRPNFDKKPISTFIINYFEEISTLDVAKIAHDLDRLRRMAEILPHSFFAHWITDFDTLFQLWEKDGPRLIAFADGLEQPLYYSAIDQGQEKKINPLNTFLSIYAEDLALAEQLFVYVASPISQARQVGHVILSEGQNRQQIKEWLQLCSGMANPSEANRFLAFYKKSPALAGPLMAYSMVIEALLKKHTSTLEITQNEIEQAFAEIGLKEVYKENYKTAEASWETVLVRMSEDSPTFAERIYAFIKFNYSPKNPLTCPQELKDFLNQIPREEQNFYQELAHCSASEAQMLLDFLGNTYGLRIGIKIISMMQNVSDRAALFSFLKEHFHFPNLLDFYFLQGNETFELLMEKADLLGQENVSLILSCYEVPTSVMNKILRQTTSRQQLEPWLMILRSGRRDLITGIKSNLEGIDLTFLEEILLKPEKNAEFLQVLKVLSQSELKNSCLADLKDHPLLVNLCQFFDSISICREVYRLLSKACKDPDKESLRLCWRKILCQLSPNDPNSLKIAQVIYKERFSLEDSDFLPNRVIVYTALFLTQPDLAFKLADLYLEGYASEFYTLLEVWDEPSENKKEKIFAIYLNQADSTKGEFLKHVNALEESEDSDLIEFILNEDSREYSEHLVFFHAVTHRAQVNTVLGFLRVSPAQRTLYQVTALELLKKGSYQALRHLLSQEKLFWDEFPAPLKIRETLLDIQKSSHCTTSIQKGIQALLSLVDKECALLKLLGITQYLLRHDRSQLLELPPESYLTELENLYLNSPSHPDAKLKYRWKEMQDKRSENVKEIQGKLFKRVLDLESAYETFVSQYLSHCLLTDSGGVNSILYPTVLETVFRMLPIIPLDSSYRVYLHSALSDITEHQAEYNAHFYTIKASSPKPHIQELLQASKLPQEEESQPDQVTREAILGALLTRNRQSEVGSCFGTQTAIGSQSYHKGLLQALTDYKYLLQYECIPKFKRRNLVEFPIVIPDRNSIPDRPLARAREYTIAQMSSTASESSQPLSDTTELFTPRHFSDRGNGPLGRRFEVILKRKFRKGDDLLELLNLSTLFEETLNKVAKTTYLPDKVSNKDDKGAWVLTYRDTEELIGTPKSYLIFIKNLLREFQKQVRIESSLSDTDKKIAVGALEDLDEEIGKDDSFLWDVLSQYPENRGVNDPIQQYEALEHLPWIHFGGGQTKTLQNTYFQKELKQSLYVAANDPEETLNSLQKILLHFSEKEKSFLRENPHALFSCAIPGHACNVKLQTLFCMTDNKQSAIEDLKNKMQFVRQAKISRETREKICKTLAWTDNSLSAREKQHLEKLMLFSTSTDHTVGAVCEHCRAVLVSYLGSSDIFDAESTFEVPLVKILRDAKIHVPPPLAIMDMNWNSIENSNCYIGYRAGLLSDRILRFRHSDGGGKEVAMKRTDYPNLSSPLFIRAAFFD